MRKVIVICAALAACALGTIAAAPAQAVETTLCETSHVTEICTNPFPPRSYEAAGTT
jgi:hypothetical protein